MANITESLNLALAIEGTMGAALGDWKTGFALGQASANSAFPSEKLEVAIALNAEVIKAKNKARQGLGLKANIEDILITLENQYHLIRLCQTIPGVFFYLAMDREKANLGLARIKLRSIEKTLEL